MFFFLSVLIFSFLLSTFYFLLFSKGKNMSENGIRQEEQKSKRTVPDDSCPRHSYGGQAVIEGVMMRGKKHMAIAVRKPDGEIIIKKDEVSAIERSAIAQVPIIRGVVVFFSAMVTGIKAITYSAEFFEEPTEAEKSKFDKWLEKKLGDKLDDYVMYFSVIMAVFLAAGLFFIFPTFAISMTKGVIKSPILMNLLEGVLRIAMFIAYVLLISRMKDIRRVFEYHGAEHKTIFCFENKQELTVENASKFTTLHPRCGTSFIVFVMLISIIIFSFVGWPNLLVRILSRLILLPVVAGLSYEVLKWAGRSESTLVKVLSWPGLRFQKLTTKEPDEDQIEVAIASLKAVFEMEAAEKEEDNKSDTETVNS